MRLDQTSDGWTVTSPDTSASYAANSQAVDQRLQTLPAVKMGAVATRQPDKHPQYSVDSTGTMFTMLGEGGEALGQLIVGCTQIRRIDFQYPADSSFTVERVTQSDTTAAPNDWVTAGDTLARNEVASMLQFLTSPQADGFVEGMSPQDLSEAPYTIRVHLADGSQRALRLRPDSEGQHYLATAEGYPYVVELRRANWDRSVFRDRSAFLQSE